MAKEMADVSNRVNFGSWAGRLTCPEKSGQLAWADGSDLANECPAYWAGLPGLPDNVNIWRYRDLSEW